MGFGGGGGGGGGGEHLPSTLPKKNYIGGEGCPAKP